MNICKHCNLAKLKPRARICTNCSKKNNAEYGKRYYWENREKILNSKKNDDAKKRKKKYNREYYLKNREKIRKKNKRYYLINRDHILEQQRRNRPVFFSIIDELDQPYEEENRGTIEIDDVFSVVSDDEKNVLNHILKNGGNVDCTEINEELEEIRKKVLSVYG